VATGTTTPVITLNVPTASAANRGALSAADWSTFNTKVGSVTASSPLASSGGSTPNITIQQSSGSQDGYLSSTDWTTFNSKQAAGNYITSLTGEATASGPGAAAVTLNNASVTGKVLTGVNITGGTVQATDTMLTAFGKLQNQINGLIGSTIYQGTWNASTNTPALASGVGVRGYYYIVSVAGTTNLDGITDWFVGDWAIFDGTAWQQVDNTDAVVSVNGQTGAVSLTTDNISEGSTNLYYLDSRARAALSFTAGSGAYNSTTGVITIPTNTNQLTNGASFITLASLSGTAPIQYNNTTGAISITQAGTASNGFLSSTDWNTFNNKAPSVVGGYLPLSGGTLTGALGGTSADFSSDVQSSSFFRSNTPATNSITIGVSANTNYGYIGNNNNWGIRTGISGDFNIDVNNSATPINAFKISQNGAATFSSSVFISESANILRFGNALRWGFQRPTSDNRFVSFYRTLHTTGVPVWTVDGDNGYVGINTITPLAFLDVAMVSNGTRRLLVNYADSIVTIKSSNDVNNGENLRLIGDNIFFNSGSSGSGTQRLTITSAGNVGIGVTPIATSGVTELALGSSNTNPRLSGIRDGIDAFYLYSDSGGTLLYERRNLDLKLGTNNSEKIRIFSNGNTFIGTSPADAGFKLDVNGTGRFSSTVQINQTASEIQQIINSNASSKPSITQYQVANSGGWEVGMANLANNYSFIFSYGTFGSTNNKFTLTSSGAGTFASSITAGGSITSDSTLGGASLNIVNSQSRFRITSNFAGGGDLLSGTLISLEDVTNNNLTIIPSAAGTAGSTIVAAAWNGSAWRSMWEFANVGSGNSNLILVKSGGNVGINKTSPAAALVIGATKNDSNPYYWLTFRNLASGYGTWGISKRNNNDLGFTYSTDTDNPNTGTALLLTYGGSVIVNGNSGVSGGGALQVNGNVNINGLFQINGVTIGGGGGSGVTGSGTTDFLTKWTGGTTLGNSSISDNGSTVSVRSGVIFQVNRADNGRALQLYTTNDECVVNSWEASSEPLHIRSMGAGGRIQFFTAGAERMRIISNGNVGIGTNAPSDFIDAGLGLAIISTSGRTGLSLGSTQGTANEVLGRLSFTNTNSTNIGSKRLAFISGLRGSTNNSAYLEFGTANDALGTQRMVIAQTGNVLINTSTDAGYKLDVNGGTRIQGNLRLDGSSIDSPLLTIVGVTNTLITMGDSTSATTDVGIIQIRNAGTPVIQLDAGSGTNSYFNTGGGLLINTATDAGAGYKLQVNGSMLMTYASFFNFRGSSPAGDVLVDNSGSTLRITGNVTVAGSVTATGGFFDTSDSRLKIIITDNHIAKGIEKVAAKFYVKNGKRELGYFAQDLQEILPSAVGEGTDGFLTLSYSQVHTAKIALIEDEVTILKNRVSDLESKLLKYEA
jgi:hypothetical protein